MVAGLNTELDAFDGSWPQGGLNFHEQVSNDEMEPSYEPRGQMNHDHDAYTKGDLEYSTYQHYYYSHQEHVAIANPAGDVAFPPYPESQLLLPIHHDNSDSRPFIPVNPYCNMHPPSFFPHRDNSTVSHHTHEGTMFDRELEPYTQVLFPMQMEDASTPPMDSVEGTLSSCNPQLPQPTSSTSLPQIGWPFDADYNHQATTMLPPAQHFNLPGPNPFGEYHGLGPYHSGYSSSPTSSSPSSSLSDTSASSNMFLLEVSSMSTSTIPSAAPVSAQPSGTFEEITGCPHTHTVTYLAKTSTQTTTQHVFRLPSKQTLISRPLPVCEPDNWRGAKAQEHGSLWDHSYTCGWVGCNTQYRRIEALDGDEFINKIHEHLLSHMNSPPEKRPWSCKWEGCAHRGKFEDSKSRLRHLHLHIPWYFVCPTCHQMRGRKDMKKKTCTCPAP